MLAIETIWLMLGASGAASLVLAALFLFRKSGKDYELQRNEGPASGFDLGAQQRELNEERARLEEERKRAEADARNMAAQANDTLARAADEESLELKKLAQDSAPPIFESPELAARRAAADATREAELQAAIRAHEAEIAATVRDQNERIEHLKREQQRAIDQARAEFERAHDAHFSTLRNSEPPPANVSFTGATPFQRLANTMQAGYAQVAWAFAALARKLE